jgi:arylsulfatase A-like enzyme
MTVRGSGRLVVAVIVLGAGALILGLWQVGRRLRPPRPNVLLLTLDTTRSDALGCYGGPRARTPHLDALAAESVLFRQAIVNTPYTGPSHASMLTGLYPPQHGLRDFLNDAVPDAVTTVAEILKAGGYETAAFLSSYVLDRRYGLAQGFDVYSCDFWHGPPAGAAADAVQAPPAGVRLERRAEETIGEAATWVERWTERTQRREAEHPFFVWIHLYDPHAPYDPPPRFRTVRPDDATVETWERLRRLYYDEVTAMDAAIGRLISYLRASKVYERLIVIVIADHGELLGEHGRMSEHSTLLIDALLRVPLLLRVPGRLHPVAVDEQVRAADVFPTILEAVGLPVPTGIEGRSLFPLAQGLPEAPRTAYAETFYEAFPQRAVPGQELAAVRMPRWKLLERPGREELYDLAADAAEETDVAAAHAREVGVLRDELARLRAHWAAGTGAAAGGHGLGLSDAERAEHERRLRSLGYIQ